MMSNHTDGMMNSEDFSLLLAGVDAQELLADEEIIPDSYDSVPSNENFSGPLGFDVLIPPSKSLVYSSKLQKLFIKMAMDFTVLFTWNFQVKGLFVRARPRFSNHEDANKPVKRCLQHSHEKDHSNRDANGPIRHHILRCKNTQAQYDGGRDQHFSVYVPLVSPETGTETVPHTFQFVCQSSCASGMNRRPIEVIFTLEDDCGEIHGRKSINVRICSCPKRDKEKEEADADNMAPGQAPPNKRRKNNNKEVSDEEHDLDIHSVTIKVVGRRGKRALLESAYNQLAGQMLSDPGNEHIFRPLFEELKNRMQGHY